MKMAGICRHPPQNSNPRAGKVHSWTQITFSSFSVMLSAPWDIAICPMERALPTTVELCQFDSSHANDRFPFFFPQQRKLMGSSAQNSSGVHWCRRRVKFCIPSVSQTRTVPQSINGQTGAKKNLEKLAQLEMSNAEDGVTLGTVNVKDAFLMVDQPTPLRVQLPFGNLIVLKNLPGQRLGAKCWCWHFRVFLTLTFNMEWCPVTLAAQSVFWSVSWWDFLMVLRWFQVQMWTRRFSCLNKVLDVPMQSKWRTYQAHFPMKKPSTIDQW